MLIAHKRKHTATRTTHTIRSNKTSGLHATVGSVNFLDFPRIPGKMCFFSEKVCLPCCFTLFERHARICKVAPSQNGLLRVYMSVEIHFFLIVLLSNPFLYLYNAAFVISNMCTRQPCHLQANRTKTPHPHVLVRVKNIAFAPVVSI